jgi:hypothetical protein
VSLKHLIESAIDPIEAMKLISDPVDAMRLASDLYALNAYRAERALTALARVPAPPPPKPISNAIRDLTSALTAQLSAIIVLLTPDERARLQGMAPGVSRQLDLGDVDLTEHILRLITMPPADAVAWIRERLDANADVGEP